LSAELSKFFKEARDIVEKLNAKFIFQKSSLLLQKWRKLWLTIERNVRMTERWKKRKLENIFEIRRNSNEKKSRKMEKLFLVIQSGMEELNLNFHANFQYNIPVFTLSLSKILLYNHDQSYKKFNALTNKNVRIFWFQLIQ